MIPYYSKRNQVYPVLRDGCAAVSKHFARAEDRARELSLYARLSGQLPLPQVLDAPEGALVLEHLPHPSLLEELEWQEQTGFSPEPWLALCRWLGKCHEVCGQLPDDGNLRNFLWDAGNGEVIGLDLEGYTPRSLAELGADLCASVLTYAPENTPVKEQVSACLAAQLGVDADRISAARAALSRSRGEKRPAPLSGIILAGGRSSRMGRDKARLMLGGHTLLELQAEKLRALGITDILLSGEGCLPCPVPGSFPTSIPTAARWAVCMPACRRQSIRPVWCSAWTPRCSSCPLWHSCAAATRRALPSCATGTNRNR